MRSVMRTSVILLALQVSEYLQDNGKTEKSQAGQCWSFSKVFALFFEFVTWFAVCRARKKTEKAREMY